MFCYYVVGVMIMRVIMDHYVITTNVIIVNDIDVKVIVIVKVIVNDIDVKVISYVNLLLLTHDDDH